MHLQAILHCIDFWKTLSLWYLSTSRYYWVRALITVAFSFILCHFFRVGKAEDIYLFRSIHLFCVPCLYEPSLESQSTVSKEVHEVSTRSYWGVFTPPLGHLWGCHPAADGERRGGWGTGGSPRASPVGGFPVLLCSPALCSLCCCLLPSLGTLNNFISLRYLEGWL